MFRNLIKKSKNISIKKKVNFFFPSCPSFVFEQKCVHNLCSLNLLFTQNFTLSTQKGLLTQKVSKIQHQNANHNDLPKSHKRSKKEPKNFRG